LSDLHVAICRSKQTFSLFIEKGYRVGGIIQLVPFAMAKTGTYSFFLFFRNVLWQLFRIIIFLAAQPVKF
ncbi:MAG TPA: hypothetical protein PKJ24_03820, partial [Prolixibacteraceae bacterium]|nr:hypothetical protein [Prolixibacteraceae bacterium]